MKSIVFITTMHSRGWGGSEQLWAEAALEAHAKGYRVGVVVFFEDFVHERFLQLEQQGISLWIVRRVESLSFVNRVNNKWVRTRSGLPNLPHHYFTLLQWLKQLAPEAIVVNQGGTFTFVDFPEILYLLKNYPLPYFLISQHHYEHGSLHPSVADRATTYLPCFKTMFFVSERNRQVAKRQLATKHLPEMDTVKNPCKLQLDAPLPYPVEATLKLAALTRLDCKNKALDLLFEALTDEVFAKYDWLLDIWGTGPDEQYLKLLITYFGLESKIHFHGQTNDILKVWEEHQILILPSYNEGTPLSIMEALMCGRPCFVTDVGDNEKLIEDGENGYLVPAPTLKLIREHLIRCFEDHARWETMGVNGHRSVKTYIEANAGRVLLEKIESRVAPQSRS